MAIMSITLKDERIQIDLSQKNALRRDALALAKCL